MHAAVDFRRMRLALMLAALAAITTRAATQFDPARVLSEVPAVAARFPDPDVRYGTPGLRAGRLDARGAIDDGANIRVFRVRLAAAGLDRVEAGSFYVSLAQPLAGLAIAALEPDSQNSYAANRLLELDGNRLRRVLDVPPATKR